MSRFNVVSFRLTIPSATQAVSPLTVSLDCMSSQLHSITIFGYNSAGGGGIDFSKQGFRLRNGSQLLIPDQGSADQITPLNAGELGWSAWSTEAITLNMGRRDLTGTPYTVTLDFYNVSGAAQIVAGFVTTCQPELTMHDLVMEIKRYQENIRPIVYDPEIMPDKNSQRPPYSLQEIKNK
jgi:hypothetical protein